MWMGEGGGGGGGGKGLHSVQYFSIDVEHVKQRKGGF